MAYLGRQTGKTALTSADIPDDSITAAKIADGAVAVADIGDNAVTLAKMAGGTDGQIITYDASGDPIAVGPGTDGQVLTSTGAGSPPAFEAIPDSGSVLQTVMKTSNTATSTTGTAAMVPSVNITPSSSSNRILVFWWAPIKLHGNNDSNADKGWSIGALRRTISGSSTDIDFGAGITTGQAYYQNYFALGSTFGSTHQLKSTMSFQYLDSPNTTSQITYLPVGKAHQAQLTVSPDSALSVIIVQELSSSEVQ